jgi:hypothetical protein
MIGGTPHQGGATWAVLQYLLGFRQLGCDVWFVEPVQSFAGDQYVASAMAQAGLGDRWALVAADGSVRGLDRARLDTIAKRADVLVSVSGMLTDPAFLEKVPVRAYLDLDPGFVQLWHAQGIDMRLDRHTHFVTISDAVGRPGGLIPDCGKDWIVTVPPVVLSEWPLAGRVQIEALTSVGHWRGYGSVEHQGTHLGQRVHSLRPLVELPTRCPVPVRVAYAIHPDETADIAALAEHRWELLDPDAVAGDPDRYRAFVQGSFAELSIAKSGYVVSDSGWFSDRSACYLASGRPVIAQSTGFERRLPTGAGLWPFSTVDGVVAAVRELVADYEHHRESARQLAVDHLDSNRVLAALLDRLLA